MLVHGELEGCEGEVATCQGGVAAPEGEGVCAKAREGLERCVCAVFSCAVDHLGVLFDYFGWGQDGAGDELGDGGGGGVD